MNYQRELDYYKEVYKISLLTANIANLFGGKVKAKDFMGDPPRRKREIEEDMRRAREAAIAKGIHIPDER